uniref:Uncharacterized protein n=1 Tax=Cajanus cajan TaxID=3821 RepID=A0A151S235_CAJCA|nr:hypothetical protein KK1_029416 [Cajanus cajan]
MSTSLPESENSELVLVDELDTFVDQMTCFCPLSTTRLPSSEMVTTPEESFNGWFLLATLMPVDSDFHQIPT